MANSLNESRGLNCGMNHQLRPFLSLQSLKAVLSLWWSYMLRTLLSFASPNRVIINIVSALLILTFIRLASFLWDIGKQWRPRPEAKERVSTVRLQNALSKLE